MWIDRLMPERLLAVARQFPALVLTGARQTGKTSLLQHVFPKAEFVSLDLPSIAHLAQAGGDEFLRERREPVILDEVQYAPGLFRFLKVAIDRDRHRMGRFLMTGSQKFTLMKSLSESLAGRCAVLELDTLSARELRGAFGRKAPGLPELLWRGGYPELHRSAEVETGVFYSSYVATYLERDVRQALRVGSLRDFERFVRACALRSSQLLNLTDLARDVGIAGSTARDWISVLDASNQVTLLEPYFNNAGKRMIKTPKLFFRDTGLLCFLLGLDSPAALVRSSFIGPVWETFVLQQIRTAKAVAGSAAGLYFWRDAHGTEVDFVLEHNGRLRLIEAKWAETFTDLKAVLPMLKVRQLLGKRAAAEHWIVCRTERAHPLPGENGVRCLNGGDFDGWLSD